MLHDRLARAEGAGDGCGAALCYGEHRVNDALSAVHGAVRRVLGRVGPGDSHGPALNEVELVCLALVVLEDGHSLLDGVVAALDALDNAAHSGRHHYLVEHGRGFLHRADDVAAGDVLADLGYGVEMPDALAVERGHLHAAGDALARQIPNLRQRALNSVVYVLKHTGAELDGKGQPRSLDNGAGSKARGLLVDLDGRAVAGHIQYFAYEPLFAHADDVRHVGVGKSICDDQRARNFGYDSAHLQTLFTKYPSQRLSRPRPSARSGRAPGGLPCLG